MVVIKLNKALNTNNTSNVTMEGLVPPLPDKDNDWRDRVTGEKNSFTGNKLASWKMESFFQNSILPGVTGTNASVGLLEHFISAIARWAPA